MWVRCGCGYSIYDDLECYFKGESLERRPIE